jgi:hypothetical protein
MSQSIRRFGLALIVGAALLASCRATETACQEQVRAYSQQLSPITAEWGTVTQRASSAAPADLPPALDTMQALRRRTDGVAVPECAKSAHGMLTQSMDMQLQGFRDTMDNKPAAAIQQEFSTAAQLFASFENELRRLASPNL